MQAQDFEKSPEDGKVSVIRVALESSVDDEEDFVAVEEPLEIQLGVFVSGTYRQQPISVTMRTPGHDLELAAGFLFTEGIVRSSSEIKAIEHCGRSTNPENSVRVDLVDETVIDVKRIERNFYTTSSCGVCGKTSLEALATNATPVAGARLAIGSSVIHSLPDQLRKRQSTFDRTGGLHAAGLFSADGTLLSLREDVGRHNAVDKLIGERFLAGDIPLDSRILFLSGRASFELMQKAVMAGIPVVCSVGAPSSLAIQTAKEFGVTLLGFVRDNRFNIYSGGNRLVDAK